MALSVCLYVAVCDSKNITHTPCAATKERKRQKRVCEGEEGRVEEGNELVQFMLNKLKLQFNVSILQTALNRAEPQHSAAHLVGIAN